MMEMQMAFAGNSDSEDEDTKVHHHHHHIHHPHHYHHHEFDNEKANCVAIKVARKNAREEQNREWRKKREMARWENIFFICNVECKFH